MREHVSVESYVRGNIDLGSIAHIVWGFLTVVSSLLNISLPLAFTATFLFYQLVDTKDTPIEKLGDVVEFSIGMVVGLIVVFVLMII